MGNFMPGSAIVPTGATDAGAACGACVLWRLELVCIGAERLQTLPQMLQALGDFHGTEVGSIFGFFRFFFVLAQFLQLRLRNSKVGTGNIEGRSGCVGPL